MTTSSSRLRTDPDHSPPPDPDRGRRRDVAAVALAVALFALAAGIGWRLQVTDHSLKVDWPPLYAKWLPHLGPGTVAALTVAVAAVAYGPALAPRLPWRRLLLVTWLTSLAWLWSLALVDGWHRGVAGQLEDKHEYLRHGLERWADTGAALRAFTDHILLDAPDNWPAHIAGHPPGAILTFVGLDRIGLGGGAWGAVFVLTVAASAAVAVLVTVRALGGEGIARRAAPFLVLAPWAVWAGVSADGYFAAVAAWGVALLALAATRAVRRPAVAALGAGLLLGWSVYLSYGLTLTVVLVAAVLGCARTLRPLPWALLGAAAIVLTFTAVGFWWWEGYQLLHERYYQGVARIRPHGYWVWANLACAVASSGLAAVAGVRRAVAALPRVVARVVTRGARPEGTATAVVLVVAGLLCVMAADLSGLSKAETERIWLPFTLWLLPAAALLPTRDHRRWLAAQAALALAVNHLLLTGW